ncbi:unnamed protein product [Discula destructiva]
MRSKEEAVFDVSPTTPTTPRWPFDESQQNVDSTTRLGGNVPPASPRDIPLPAAPRSSHSRHVIRYWALEIATVIVALLLLAAIIALLSYYDGRYMPEWPFDINLNSAIAFLSTFLKASIVAAVAEIIGQIKWTWFTERTRPLHHLQDFDAASRSVLGSMRLMFVVVWNMGFTSAGLLGISAALVTIASLGVGPVTQQAIRTVACPLLVPNARSAMPSAHYVPGTSAYYRVGAGLYELEVDMKSRMIKGLTESPDSASTGVDVNCKTGNCTWPDYGTGVTHASIGLCSKCLDTTDFVSEPQLGNNLTLPDYEAFINYGSGHYMWIGYSNLSAYTSIFTDEFTEAAASSVSNFSMLAASSSPCSTDADTGKMTCPHKIAQSSNAYFDGLGDYVAASCVFYPCLKEYWGRYENNVLAEHLVKETVATLNKQETTDSYSSFYNYTATRHPCVLDNGTWYDYGNQTTAPHIPGRTWANITITDAQGDSKNISAPNACLYKMDGIFASAVSYFLSELFDGSCFYDSSQSGHISCGTSWWLTPLWNDMNATFTTLDGAMTDFAKAVTNKFRMTGTGPDQHQGGPADPALEYGSVYETSTCTYFDRQWIALPIILVGICIILLVWICVKNYHDPEQPVWKGSVLPLMFFGLSGPGGMMHHDSTPDMPERDRRDRNATFFRQNGRAAPELDKIQGEAGKMLVRFTGGTDPRFVDLGGRRGNRQVDAEASVVELVPKVQNRD